MARSQRSAGQRRGQRASRAVRHLDNDGIIPVLARAVREVETAVGRGSALASIKPKFQVIALLVRDERFRIKADQSGTEAYRAEQLKRLDGIATILAQTAARRPELFGLLAEDAEISEAARTLKREMLTAGGVELPAEPEPVADESTVAATERQVVPTSVAARRLASPFHTPDYSGVRRSVSQTHRLAGWELLGPLFRSFEEAEGGASSCMALPEEAPRAVVGARGRELMLHQAQLVASAALGHRTYLLADEPGLGKTAQALLAAQAAQAFPLLVVVPNVVKNNWAAEAARWTPRHPVTVVNGDGHDVDGFADIVVVNYEILDRHAGWMAQHGFRGMVVDEAHFIKNKTSQRSQHVLALSAAIRERVGRPLLMALTGTPLINDIEDFRAIWQFLGWIDDKKPLPPLMDSLEEVGLTPADRGFYPSARGKVVDMGIVRRRKVDVASDIPARRVADLTVELDGEAGRSIAKAERELVRRLVARYDTALETRTSGPMITGADGIDHELVRRVATWEREDSTAKTGENVFSMMRRIGQAKAGLAADYAAQLARNVGKVVFFAKHVDVMDDAEELFASRGIGYASIRGDQSATARAKALRSFDEDPECEVIVCSLTAAGVGLNLQVSSNLVLAELSWTDAEQTQAIDRVHRIGQTEPVTAWRVIAAQTIDARIAELIGTKAGLAARALDGAGESAEAAADVQLEALVAMLTDALCERA